MSTSSGPLHATTGSGDGARGQDAAARSRVAPLVVWFAVLGGAVAWAVHEVAGWLLTELPCIRGHQEVLGLGLRSVTAVTTVVPGLVALTALVLALLGGRSLRDAGDDRRTTRARFMLRIGAWLDALAVMMIVFGGIAVATLPPCAQGGLTREQAAGGLSLDALRPAAFTVPAMGQTTLPLHPAHGAAAEAAGAWTLLDVALLAVLAATAVAYLAGAARYAGSRPSLRAGTARLGRWRVLAFLGGLLTVSVALGPWVDHLADERFSAHMGQHMLLIVVAAPLLAAGAPGVPLVLALPRRSRGTVARARLVVRRAPGLRLLFLPVTAWLLQVAALWIWHLPPAFDAALRWEWMHVLEHACFLLTAWMFWWHVLQAGRRRMSGAVAVLYVFAATMPAAALGAVLTFAGTPLYPAQAAAAATAGVDPLTDQQVAGLVMWVPPDVVYLLMTVALFLPWLGRLAGDEPTVTATPSVRAPALEEAP